MKKAILVLVCFAVVVLALAKNGSLSNKRIVDPPIFPSPEVQSIQERIVAPAKSSVFVPYWGIGRGTISSDYDRYYYFGIATTKDDVDITEVGYRNIPKFISAMPSGKEKYLVVRMVDQTINSAVLRDKSAQEKIVASSLKISRENNFDGVVLDFEINALAFESVTQEINSFISLFGDRAKIEAMPFYITLYGDTFYRLRPYDVKTLANSVDGIMIMSYDLSKAKGNPGPSFPLQGSEQYGYDLSKMVEDFTSVVDPKKTTVIFGYFGYDWTLDNKNNSVEIAKPLTYNEIVSKFLPTCNLKNCVIKRDTKSGESNILYTDPQNNNHSVWFEDKQSIEAKQQFLQTKGIDAISLWAYSYF